MERAQCGEEFGVGHRRKPRLGRLKVRRQAVRFHLKKFQAQDFERLANEHQVHIQGNQQCFKIGKEGFFRYGQFRLHRTARLRGMMHYGCCQVRWSSSLARLKFSASGHSASPPLAESRLTARRPYDANIPAGAFKRFDQRRRHGQHPDMGVLAAALLRRAAIPSGREDSKPGHGLYFQAVI
jgi:hypothetical protein